MMYFPSPHLGKNMSTFKEGTDLYHDSYIFSFRELTARVSSNLGECTNGTIKLL